MIGYIQVALFKHLDSYLIFHLLERELISGNIYLEERLFCGRFNWFLMFSLVILVFMVQ